GVRVGLCRRAARPAQEMGHQMKVRTSSLLAAVWLGLCATPATAQEDADRPTGAATLDAFASTDADDTEVVRTGLNLDWFRPNEDRYIGLRVEKAWFTPLGQETAAFERVYLRYADRAAGWSWNAQVGTDGHTVLGSFN